jgi:hypothetical protein
LLYANLGRENQSMGISSMSGCCKNGTIKLKYNFIEGLADFILLLLWTPWCTSYELHIYFPNSYFVNIDQITNTIIIIRAL